MKSFHIDKWVVDIDSNRLSFEQTEIKIETKTMEVLVYLAKRQNEIVSREQLERDVWAGKVVGYDSLTNIITKLRKALNDDPRQPSYIETISKKGYRLIAPVNVSTSEDDNQVTPNKTVTPGKTALHRPVWLVPAMVLLVALFIIFMFTQQNPSDIEQSAAEKSSIKPHLSNTGVNSAESDNSGLINSDNNTPSIAILPFSDLSEHATHSYLSDGITEDITTALSKLSGLFVVAQSATLNYRNQTVDAQFAAKQLRVRYVLDGSIRQIASKLRVNIKLVDGSSGVVLWSEVYNRQIKDIFEVQDDITQNIVNTLSIKLSAEEKRRSAKRYTVSLDAYDEFLQGQVLYSHFTREDNLWAREAYLKSIDIDPNFARAYAALALTYSTEYRYRWQNDIDKSLHKAAKLAKKAVSIDDQLPNAFWVLGFVNLHLQKYNLAIESAKKAIALNPNYADGYATLGISYVYAGDPQQGITMMRKAMRLNPQYPAAYASAIGQAYYFLKSYEEAIVPLRDAIERNFSLRSPHVFLVSALSQLGKNDEASWAAIQLRTLEPDLSIENFVAMFPIKDKKQIQDIEKHLKRAGL